MEEDRKKLKFGNLKSILSKKLIRAIERNDFDLVVDLVEQGADIHAKSDEALIAAIKKESFKIVKYLIKHRIKDLALNDDVLLLYAAKKENLEIVNFLVEYRNNLCGTNDKVFIRFLQNGNLNIVKYLVIEQNCDINVALNIAREPPVQVETALWCQKYIQTKKFNEKLINELHLDNNKISNRKPKV